MELNCKKCGSPLEWADTIRNFGGIQEGYIIERQVWCCEQCKIDYIVEQRAEFLENDVNIIYFEEA